ncbi:sigma-70 family RNA polymerase sigma factor [Microbacterium sp. H1-D42]|uniref:RNA polymerase sigma factor n=1 Tax=Microbacterium sp. H1-D42 TaxID=2925844 RepID=UPI001F536AB8|nr:sigma-70 family RNA polymerase sigma factor [Microbacterium sp. H1-D42]UNK71569.1 sigma-70 family RNA polymerase sigma factor [Microbacterium sp. H1-D42]
MSEQNDETEIWSRARTDSGEAFAELFRRHRDSVFRRAAALVDRMQDADDATAIAFFELWRKRRSVVLVDGTVLPWLLVAVTNTARNQRRGSVRYRRLLAALPRSDARDAEQEALTAIETEVLGIRLREALSVLDPKDAALLTLTALDGLSVADAAPLVGLKAGAARTRLMRARRRLQDRLGRHPSHVTWSLSEGERA